MKHTLTIFFILLSFNLHAGMLIGGAVSAGTSYTIMSEYDGDDPPASFVARSNISG